MAKSPLVTIEWLKNKLGNDDIQLFDCSYHLPSARRDARSEYERQCIAGARFFDIDVIADIKSPYPHTLPSREGFLTSSKDLGLNPDKTQILYDNSELHSAARGWWLLRVFGFEKVYILDGGLKKWIEGNGALERGTFEATDTLPRDLSGLSIRHGLFTDIEGVKDAIESNLQIIDARSTGRFNGSAPEPRPELSSGHMAGAYNLPYQELFKADGTYQNKDVLIDRFNDLNIDIDKHVITSCGSGITACTIAAALAIVGKWDTTVYDGSWLEWASQKDAHMHIEKSE